ncbi:uncharacterized protein [Acropora muricata]|uniref:uncharacterized protein n=1 Tax=Acropora muricata TaxID=159855 RepID=UPI0034E3BBEC
MELSSPPKPTRITQCLIPNLMEEKLGQQREETFRPEDCFEQDGNESGAEAISLSALAGEVADAQKQQINDLSKKLEILEELKEKQRQVLLKINFVKEDIAAVSRKVYLTEDETAKTKKNCDLLEKEIEDLIYSKGIITKQLAMAKENLVKDKETYGRYQMKMEAHIKRVEIYESSCNRNTKNQRWGNKIVEEGIVYVFLVVCADDKLQEAINNFPPNTVSREEKLNQVVCFMNKPGRQRSRNNRESRRT